MSAPQVTQKNAPSLFKSVSLAHVKQSNKVNASPSRNMRAIGDISYQFDSVDDTLDFCYTIDSSDWDSRS